MESISTIQEFNLTLINKGIKYGFREYMMKAREKYYIEIDIDFLNLFIKLIEHKEEYIVTYEDFIKYEIFGDEDDIPTSINTQYFICKEGESYIKNNKDPDLNKYKPRVFKLSLLIFNNQSRYASEFIFLEGIYDYFRDYEKAYLEKKILINEFTIEEEETKEDEVAILESETSSTADDTATVETNCMLLHHYDKHYSIVDKVVKNKGTLIKSFHNKFGDCLALAKVIKKDLKDDLDAKLDAIKNDKKLKNKIELKKAVKENVKFSILRCRITLETGTNKELIEYLDKINA